MAGTQYDNEMRVSLWVNRKREGKRDADFRGELQIGGKRYAISLWQNDADAGSRKPVLSGSVRVWEESGGNDTPAPRTAPQNPPTAAQPADDLPF